MVEAIDRSAMSEVGDGLGPDGSVYLYRYLGLSNTAWF